MATAPVNGLGRYGSGGGGDGRLGRCPSWGNEGRSRGGCAGERVSYKAQLISSRARVGPTSSNGY